MGKRYHAKPWDHFVIKPPKKRKCLRCDRVFISDANRICPVCTNHNNICFAGASVENSRAGIDY